MKKLNKLTIKKTTLRDLDEPTMKAVAGAANIAKTINADDLIHVTRGNSCCKYSCI